MKKIMISPSILSANFAQIREQCQLLVDSGADMIHFDVMDGVFVPNITFGMKMVSDLRQHVDSVFDVHLMIVDPIRYVEQFAKAGADIITFHLEACDDVNAVIDKVKQCKVKCGISIKPNTDVEAVMPYMDKVDMILVMSVEPGFGGQKFMPSAIDKIASLRSANADIDIQVDGGINSDNVTSVIEAGANIIVAGSSILCSDNIRQAIECLRR